VICAVHLQIISPVQLLVIVGKGPTVNEVYAFLQNRSHKFFFRLCTILFIDVSC